MATAALRVRVRGVVQGVGFRPFVYRQARAHGLAGWVYNGDAGVEIHLEGPEEAIRAFLAVLRDQPPPASRIAALEAEPCDAEGSAVFEIRESQKADRPTVRISPELAICFACLNELFDPTDRRFRYPYINCTDCGPRYSIVLGLPYDRPRTTMKDWPLCPDCVREYQDPLDRRFHAQPVACPRCGPHYALRVGDRITATDGDAIAGAARLLLDGWIVAVKGLGGYHLACDAHNAGAVTALRERKFRKEKPFALMVKDLETAATIAAVSPAARRLMEDVARPIMLCPARRVLAGVAPDNSELGIMLPYAPPHYLLFAMGAPEVLVMTSANRSSEPIAYGDHEALERLAGIAEAFLIGERPIARRIDDSVVRAGPFGLVMLRRARGYAPGAVATLPADRPIMALGADLKNAITLAVGGQAFVSQHIGDLDHFDAYQAFRETVRDLCELYEVAIDDMFVVHDAHPEYRSTLFALELGRPCLAVQHHRAHVASVLAERGAWDARVVGFAFDGTGYGDDGTIWGGEVFAGSLETGLARVAHLRLASLPGGDAAARFPVQAAAGFLAHMDHALRFISPPFGLGDRYRRALDLVCTGVRTFPTTSMGRLFDTVAALLGFVREITFEGQAAMWLEHLARRSRPVPPYPFPFTGEDLDFRPLLKAVVVDRLAGRAPEEIARAFHAAIARTVVDVGRALGAAYGAEAVVLSGGVFQNALLMEEIAAAIGHDPALPVWVNHQVPPNDGGISLGQAALAAATWARAVAPASPVLERRA